jgi:hypothetical protein
MRVDLYTLCWNDIAMLDFFFRHYEPWVDHFFIFDDGSDDGTREYLEKHSKVTVAPLKRSDPESWVLSAKAFYDSCWRASKGVADWVIIANIDEHLYHADMRTYLMKCRAARITAIPALGYQMIVSSFPPPASVLSRDVCQGVPWDRMSKLDIFNPDAVDDIDFAPGRHRAEVRGVLCLPDKDEVLNLHYKYLGFDYVFSRHRLQLTRLLDTDKRNRWGHKYLWDEETLQRDIAEMDRSSINVMDPHLDHHATHPGHRWWRSLKTASK